LPWISPRPTICFVSAGAGCICCPEVEKGKILAGRIKELGYARDFDGMLEALEEGPKNAIVCT